MDRPIKDTPSEGRDGASWRRSAAYVVLGTALGAAALSIGVVTMLIGLIPIGIGVAYVWRDAGAHRLSFLGGALLGIGLVSWPLLGPAVTNHDPAVHYSDGTIQLLIASLAVGAVGVLLIAIAATRTRRPTVA